MPTSSALRSGIKNYERYLNILAGTEPYVAPPLSSYDLLATEILTGSQASVTFSSLGDYASDYQHLQIRMTTQCTGTATTLTQTDLNLNGDTGSNYAYHTLNGNGSSVVSLNATSADFIRFPDTVPRTSQTGVFGAIVVDILDPFSSDKNTTLRALHGAYASGERDINLTSGVWLNTDSLTSIALNPAGNTWAEYSRFSLYGLRSA
jgi:hypothetical protein